MLSSALLPCRRAGLGLLLPWGLAWAPPGRSQSCQKKCQQKRLPGLPGGGRCQRASSAVPPSLRGCGKEGSLCPVSRVPAPAGAIGRPLPQAPAQHLPFCWEGLGVSWREGCKAWGRGWGRGQPGKVQVWGEHPGGRPSSLAPQGARRGPALCFPSDFPRFLPAVRGSNTVPNSVPIQVVVQSARLPGSSRAVSIAIQLQKALY